MQIDDAKYLKKHIIVGSIDVHPSEKALIVNYQLEATILGQLGDPMLGDRKQCQKVIRLKDLYGNTDVKSLAKEVVLKCKLIPSNRLPEVEQLLYYLQNRKLNENNEDSIDILTKNDVQQDNEELFGSASLANIDEYVENLYDELPKKVLATQMILKICKNPDNLQAVLQNDSLMGALARVLREDYKKSLDLSTNIMFIFFCFSKFSQFHSMISHFKIGALSMQIIESELNRFKIWEEDLKSKNNNFDASFGTDDYEQLFRKFQSLVKKQDQLLRVSIYLLLNLAEEISTEIKMIRRGLLSLLIQTLRRPSNNIPLQTLILTFLKKLSVFSSNVKELSGVNITNDVMQFCQIDLQDDAILQAVVRLLYNLSFDCNLRKTLCNLNFILNISNLVLSRSLSESEWILKLLYQISIEVNARSLFTKSCIIPYALNLIKEKHPSEIEVLIALMINLSTINANATAICGTNGDQLHILVKQTLKYKSLHLLKLVSNLSHHLPPFPNYFVDYLSDFASCVLKCDNDDFQLELVHILGALYLPNLDYALLLKEYKLTDWILQKLQTKVCTDDMLLAIVILLGSAAQDVNAALWMLESSLVGILVSTLTAKQEDDEIVLQILYCLNQLLSHKSLRNEVLAISKLGELLIDLAHDNNQRIRTLCNSTLEVLQDECGAEWTVQLLDEKFRWHNAQWLTMLEREHQKPMLQIASPQSDVFAELYGIDSEEILNNYAVDERPISRMAVRGDTQNQFVHSDDDIG